MRTVKKKVFILMVGLALSLLAGCAPTLVSISTPKFQTAENSYYTAQFEPLGEGQNFFDGFLLKVTNKTPKDLEIDWNKTRYLYNGRDLGIFVFDGIQPGDIKNLTIPPDIIPSDHSFSKEISPLKLLAREPLTGKGNKAGKITPGPIPNGKNGIFLFIRQNGNPIKEKMAVNITEKKLQ
jgi:hypothetical protein